MTRKNKMLSTIVKLFERKSEKLLLVVYITVWYGTCSHI